MHQSPNRSSGVAKKMTKVIDKINKTDHKSGHLINVLIEYQKKNAIVIERTNYRGSLAQFQDMKAALGIVDDNFPVEKLHCAVNKRIKEAEAEKARLRKLVLDLQHQLSPSLKILSQIKPIIKEFDLSVISEPLKNFDFQELISQYQSVFNKINSIRFFDDQKKKLQSEIKELERKIENKKQIKKPKNTFQSFTDDSFSQSPTSMFEGATSYPQAVINELFKNRQFNSKLKSINININDNFDELQKRISQEIFPENTKKIDNCNKVLKQVNNTMDRYLCTSMEELDFSSNSVNEIRNKLINLRQKQLENKEKLAKLVETRESTKNLSPEKLLAWYNELLDHQKKMRKDLQNKIDKTKTSIQVKEHIIKRRRNNSLVLKEQIRPLSEEIFNDDSTDLANKTNLQSKENLLKRKRNYTLVLKEQNRPTPEAILDDSK